MTHIVRERLRYALVGLAVTASLLASAGAAHAASGTWGQEVKACNQTACYPGGAQRGDYVSDQAGDDSGRGYGQEIHDLAGPGKAHPSPF